MISARYDNFKIAIVWDPRVCPYRYALPLPTRDRSPIVKYLLAVHIPLQAKKLLSWKYLALYILKRTEFGFVNNLQPCLARRERLKGLISRKPMPPTNFG